MLRRKLRRDLARQRAQFTAVALTMLLGVGLFGATFDAYRGLRASYRQAFVRYRFANLTLDGSNVAALASRVRATPGVAAVQARVQADVPLQIGAAKLLGRVIGMPSDGQPAVDRVQVTSGSYLAANRPEGVLVEEHTAAHFHLSPGDRVIVEGAGGMRSMPVVGVASSPEYYWPALSRQEVLVPADDFAVLLAPEPLAERLAGRRAPNQLTIYYSGGRDDMQLTRRLTALAYASGASAVTARADQPSNSSLQEDVSGFGELAVMFPALFLVAAALASSVVLTRMVAAQRPVIGMLRAAGLSRGVVLRHYLGFGAATGLAGGLAGALAGGLLAGPLVHLYTDSLSIPVSLTRLSPWTPIAGIAFALLAGLAAAGAPALAAARVPPGEAMRRFAPARRGHRSIAERLLPVLARLPARWRLVLRGAERNPRRSLTTALGVILALILILVSWGMIDTLQVLANRQFTQVQRQDAQLYFRGPVTPARIDEVKRAPGVASVEPAAELPVVVGRAGKRFQTSLLALEPRTTMHGFPTRGTSAPLPPDGILAGQALGRRLGIGPGAAVTVAIPSAGLRFTTRVQRFLDEPLGTYAYASLDLLRSITPSSDIVNTALVRYLPGANRKRMRAELAALPGVTAVSDSRALLDSFNKLLGFFYAIVAIMLICGAALAFALLYSTITTSTAERTTELATLRAAGAPRRALARMVTAENMLTVSLAIPPGLIAGYLAAQAFMASLHSDAYNVNLQMRTSTLVLSAIAILLVAMISQRPSLHAIQRLDVAQVVRERSL
jgi:putative ABC transport system permease protein